LIPGRRGDTQVPGGLENDEHYLQVAMGFNSKLWSNDDWMI